MKTYSYSNSTKHILWYFCIKIKWSSVHKLRTNWDFIFSEESTVKTNNVLNVTFEENVKFRKNLSLNIFCYVQLDYLQWIQSGKVKILSYHCITDQCSIDNLQARRTSSTDRSCFLAFLGILLYHLSYCLCHTVNQKNEPGRIGIEFNL